MPQIAQADARVPIELVDLIAFHLRPADGLTNPSPSLEKLEDGLVSLRACSLVCHQWRAVTLPHLFFSITCRFMPEDGLVERPVGRRRPYKTISLFCRFLENTPAVRDSIRQLLLAHRSRSSLTDGEDKLDGRLFSRLLQLCPRLNILHLHGVFISTVDVPHPPVSRVLKTLKIVPCHRGYFQQDLGAWYTAGADVAALSFFSSIDYLHLSAPVHGTPLVPETMAFLPLTVRHLEVENAGYGLQALVAALERSGAVQTIKAFTMTGCVRHRMQPVSPELDRLFSLLSPTLEEVVVRRMFHDRENVAVIPDLSHCTRLCALHVGFDLTVLVVWSTIVCLLRTVAPATPLDRLDVHMTLPKNSYEKDDFFLYTTSATIRDLDDLELAINGPTSAVLDAVDAALMQVVEVHDLPWVTVTYSAPENERVVPDVVERVFARLDEAGKLRVRRETA